MGFRVQGSRGVPESVRERFWGALDSGLSVAGAATVAGVAHTTGQRWAKAAGYQSTTKYRGVRYS